MSKQIKELKQFLQGTGSSPDSTDIPEEANVYSKNLEPLDEIGKLKGAKEDRKFRGNTPITVTIKDFATGEVAGDSGGTTTAATETADEVEVVISGTAGVGGELSLKFFGISSDSPTA